MKYIRKITVLVVAAVWQVGEEDRPQLPEPERVTGRKARGLQAEEIACKCQTFLSLLSGRRKQTNEQYFFLLYTNLKGGFS